MVLLAGSKRIRPASDASQSEPEAACVMHRTPVPSPFQVNNSGPSGAVGGEIEEIIGLRAVEAEPAGVRDPEMPFPVFKQPIDNPIRETVGVGNVAVINLEIVAVIPVQAGIRAEPHETVAVLEEGADPGVGQSILSGEVAKLEVESGWSSS